MQIDQVLSDFITGAERLGTFFDGLHKFFEGSTALEDMILGDDSDNLSAALSHFSSSEAATETAANGK